MKPIITHLEIDTDFNQIYGTICLDINKDKTERIYVNLLIDNKSKKIIDKDFTREYFTKDGEYLKYENIDIEVNENDTFLPNVNFDNLLNLLLKDEEVSYFME